MLGYFNIWNIIKFTNEVTSIQYFDEIHKIFLDCISDNFYSLVQTGKYVEMNTTDTQIMVYHFIKYVSDTFTLQEDATIDFRVIKYIELAVWKTYLSEMLSKTNWY